MVKHRFTTIQHCSTKITLISSEKLCFSGKTLFHGVKLCFTLVKHCFTMVKHSFMMVKQCFTKFTHLACHNNVPQSHPSVEGTILDLSEGSIRGIELHAHIYARTHIYVYI